MRKMYILGFALLLAVLSACTPYIYGVPKPTWDTMSEQERMEAMRLYNERQIAYRKAMEERARQNAIERQRMEARRAEEERLRQERLRQARIEAIHRGEGVYGDLIRVELQGGEMWIDGRHHHFQPFSFKIADGEFRQVTVLNNWGRQATLQVTYEGRKLIIDGPGAPRNSGAAYLMYDRTWGDGTTYAVSTDGPLQLRRVEVFVQVAGVPAKVVHRDSPPPVIVVQQPPPPQPQPQVIVIKEEVPRREPQQVIVVKEERAQPQPQVVVVEEEHRRQPPQVIVVKDDKPQPQVVVVKEENRQQPQPQVVQPPPHVATLNEKMYPPVGAPPAPPQNNRVPSVQVSQNGGNNQKPANVADNKAPGKIQIQFLSGKLKIMGKIQSIEPVTVVLNDGEAQNVAFKTGAGPQPVAISYQNGLIAIDADPSTGRGRTTVAKLPFEKDWKTGRTYRIETKGRISLQETDVKVVATGGK